MSAQALNPIEAIRPGQIIPDFCLRSTNGRWVDSMDFPGRRLILVFTGWSGRQSLRDLLRQLRAAYSRIALEDAVVLLIAPEAVDTGELAVPPVAVPFLVLRDQAGTTHRAFGAVDWSGQPALSVFITDLYRRATYRALRGLHEKVPTASEIVTLLEFDQLACRNCGGPFRLR